MCFLQLTTKPTILKIIIVRKLITNRARTVKMKINPRVVLSFSEDFGEKIEKSKQNKYRRIKMKVLSI